MNKRNSRFGQSSASSWRSNSTVVALVGVVFFVVLIASNHYSDYNLLAFSASQSPYMASSRAAPVETSVCENTKQGKYWVTDDKGRTEQEMNFRCLFI